MIYYFFPLSDSNSRVIHIQHTVSEHSEHYKKMQASINVIRQRSSSLAWRFIGSNKMKVDYSYFKEDSTNRRCISNDEKPPLPDTTREQYKLPLVKNMTESSSTFNFDKELKRCYPDPPEKVLDLFNAVCANNSSLVRNLIKSNKIDVDYALPPMTNSVLHFAAYKGYTDIVRILVEEGHATSYKNMFENTG